MNTQVPSICDFTGPNRWELFSSEFQIFLMMKGYGAFFENSTSVTTTAGPSSEPQSPESNTQGPNLATSVQSGREIDQVVRAYLAQSLRPNHSQLVLNEPTFRKAWERARKTFKRDDSESLELLVNSFFPESNMQDSEDINEFSTRLENMFTNINKLSGNDEQIPIKRLRWKFLKGLPEKFSFMTETYFREQEPFTPWEKMIQDFKSFESRHHDQFQPKNSNP